MEELMPDVKKFNAQLKTLETGFTIQNDTLESKKEYSAYLTERKLHYLSLSLYLLVGDKPAGEGWLIHISVVRQQMNQLINPVLDFLAQTKHPFMIPVNADQHSIILDGRGGLMNVGKIISIYSENEAQANSIGLALIKLTEGFQGPAIPTGVLLGSCVYVSYGNLLSDTEIYDNKNHSPIHGFNSENALLDSIRIHHIQWPFSQFISLRKKQIPRLIKNQYLPIQALKNDPKGKVLKCIKLNRLYNIQWCVLKQGKQYQCFDDSGRDIKDRLLWQFKVQTALKGLLPFPVVYEYFEMDKTACLTMDFIDGKSLSEQIITIYSGTNWKNLTKDQRLQLMDYLFQVLNIISILHANGYIHRDLNPENFIVSVEGKIYLTDFELCYSKLQNKPMPAFALGTDGYMSPQQRYQVQPDYSDDIYAFGGLLIKFFTGLSPLKFHLENIEFLYGQLTYFIPNDEICRLIRSCLHSRPQCRPGLEDIKNKIQLHQNTLCQSTIDKSTLETAFHHQHILMAIHEGNKILIRLSTTMSLQFGTIDDFCLANELAGILYVLAQFKKAGFLANNDQEFLNKQFSSLKTIPLFDTKKTASVLLTGPSGIMVSISELYRSGLFMANCIDTNQLQNLAPVRLSDLLGIANGLAGQGIAIIHSYQYLDLQIASSLLSEITQKLISNQQSDGSWIIKREESNITGVKLPGFFHGIAGITYFLMVYSIQFQHNNSKEAAIKALEHLIVNRQEQDGHMIWRLNPHIKDVNPWLEDGFTGIAYVFIRAYAYFHDSRYKEVASDALLSHPEFISSNFISLSNGLSGLGEVYIEAAKVFNENTWMSRAKRIADFFLHTGIRKSQDERLWHSDDYGDPNYSLLNGQAGIIHFLLRYAYPEYISFPLFPV